MDTRFISRVFSTSPMPPGEAVWLCASVSFRVTGNKKLVITATQPSIKVPSR